LKFGRFEVDDSKTGENKPLYPKSGSDSIQLCLKLAEKRSTLPKSGSDSIQLCLQLAEKQTTLPQKWIRFYPTLPKVG